jgi:hypothetical protein
MKVITLTQPWATLVIIGAKTLETRSWATSYRGTLGIHASKGYPLSARGIRHEPAFMEALWQGGIKPDMPLPIGCILGTVTLTGCFATPGVVQAPIRYPGGLVIPPGEPEVFFGDYSPGRFAWTMEEPEEWRDPVPAKGALGLWDWRGVPMEVLS